MGGWWSGLLRSAEEQEAVELTDQRVETGSAPICDCSRGQRVAVCGTLRSVTLRPRAKAPAVEAEVYDGTGHLTLVWLGRRSLRGVEAGRMIVARGRVTFPHGDPVIYNPEYELLPVSAS